MHRSISSASSLPDLIPSMLRDLKQTKENEVPDLGALNLKANNGPAEVTSSPIDANEGFTMQQGGGITTPVNGLGHISETPLGLSPVAESFDTAIPEEGTTNTHGRKVSAPVLSTTTKDFTVRARSATSSVAGAANRAAAAKRRGSYMLFPTV
jgi:hypothetical protein